MDISKEIQKYRQEIKSERMDMSFGEIINMYRDKEIIISPEYQRAFRWDQQRQSDFIESILLGIPFPSIFVATNPDGKWELIDGLQRVSTVLSFFNELKDENGNSYPKNGLKLVEGSMLKGLKDITIETLPLEYKLQIKRTPCRVEIILKESEFKMRYELFKRLNTGGEGLSRQEIRNCIFRGLDSRYSEFVSDLSQNDIFRDIVNISVANEEKMYYEELVLRYLTLKNKGTRYSQANIQDYMDEYLESQCKEFDDMKMQADKVLFSKIMELLESLKDENIFKLGKRYFTTSMYDAIMLSLSDNSIELEELDIEELGKKIATLKENKEFNKYVGSASSNPTSITNKVKIAKKVLLDITE
ncbi:DUF262 domain-containing protein [Lachnoclostridium phocaeense]|uniref:DUF262 domain-containing protein n=1 Tax=Lachnoclostridium phocaeense TaxID=1871021 RepID=UPI00248E770F|nr:DUF262 domain-containing protein [Lachnoclostridium phocaeense]